ncbi:MAG: amidohydrolase [Clostridiales Family XIII bacterium]|jgi:predicted amidohydrolase YtcJ|nr:amidohydrolase [Clostridiales Family XIII bacterium]
MSERVLFQNGRILTLDPLGTEAEWMLASGGKIEAVGKGAIGDLGAITKTVDLEGKTVIPSFLDAHLHLRLAAETYFGLDLSDSHGVEAYKTKILEYASSHPDASIIRGFGWSERDFGLLGPEKRILDEICPDRPIMLSAETGHALWVNSKTLEVAGIDKNTEDIGRGRIQRYADGEPSGTVQEDCQAMVTQKIPDYSVEEYKEAFLHHIAMLNRLGITAAFDAWLVPGSNAVAAFRELAKEGRLTARIRGAYVVVPTSPLQEQMDAIARSLPQDACGEAFAMTTAKFFLDGVVESSTAYLSEPYLKSDTGDPAYCGIPVWEPGKLNEAVAAAMRQGLQVETHCIGDAAVSEALDAFAYAAGLGLAGNRNKVTHIELISERDTARLAELAIVPLLNPYWAEVDDIYFELLETVGRERMDRTWPVGSIIAQGVVCAGGSDYPITELPYPLTAIEVGMTRTVSKYYHPWVADFGDKRCLRPLGPDAEKASLADMLKMFTSGAAYCMFLEDRAGSLEPGKSADFIVLDKDITQTAPEEVGGIQVLATYFQGEAVYSK